MPRPPHLRPDFLRVSPGKDLPGIVNAVIEIPKGSRNKYEVDEESGLMRLDRHLYSASVYPGDYGFVPCTLAADGDALDVLVMVNDPTFSGCLIAARVVGLFRMKDRGADDLKVLAVPDSDPLFADIRELADVPKHFLREVEHFFATYKQLEGVVVEPEGWAPRADALSAIESALIRFEETEED